MAKQKQKKNWRNTLTLIQDVFSGKLNSSEKFSSKYVNALYIFERTKAS